MNGLLRLSNVGFEFGEFWTVEYEEVGVSKSGKLGIDGEVSESATHVQKLSLRQ